MIGLTKGDTRSLDQCPAWASKTKVDCFGFSVQGFRV